ncbi:branched-chain alpha-keto acid dehydrogenase subunit E2 [Tamilnaduibacter salinus]|uniref:Dihydrolipoamide acetyltransferase component of pyruvate dehydrogenase complex n=1 Tax=Tamilnaduibacter salinus TaxID=1484056 RepID=A0A2A2I7I3_9GAMM|nr:dihydrolipoamide acetyltransferase family protein [Tamilnaduibacter salinus]PAV27254.1 branched-chain alpha-keto acid dehydrogenase subunit E2 [Tamilnaduibacter salinus]
MPYFTLPDLGEGLQEAEVVEWQIREGDTVNVDDPLLSVETAKAIVDIPAPQDGTIATLFVQPGDIVHVGEPLLAFEGDEGSGSQTVVGNLESREGDDNRDDFVVGAVTDGQPGVAVTPAIRALARHLGVNLDRIKGSGPAGSITLDDVQQHASLKQSHGDSTPLRGVARTMAKTMASAGAQVVPVSLFDQVSVAHWPDDTDITLRLIRAIVSGCQAEPQVNAWFNGEQLSRRIVDRVDLGIAVDTPDGLFVPVLRDVTNRDDADLRDGLNRLRRDVEARKIPAKELQGATLSLSNFGTLAGRFATPVVVVPQVAIVGAGKRFTQPGFRNGEVFEDVQMPLSLTFDHRALNGGQAARFLGAVLASLSE